MNQRTVIFALCALLIILGGYMSLPKGSLVGFNAGAREDEMASFLSQLEPAAGAGAAASTYRIDSDHILANHRHGMNVACKSEFPKEWDDAKILMSAQKIAANDNAGWVKEDNGYSVGEQSVEGLRVRVVLDTMDREIVTAYPLGVNRNPCPANDNEP